jgi:hypothetical protein
MLSVKRVTKIEHFAPICKYDSVLIARSRSEIIELILACLIGEKRVNLMASDFMIYYHCGTVGGKAGMRIADEVLDVTHTG